MNNLGAKIQAKQLNSTYLVWGHQSMCLFACTKRVTKGCPRIRINGFNNCKCSFHRDEKWQKCHKASMDRWNVLCLGLYMHTWCAVITTSLDHFLILTIYGTLLILYRQQDYRYSDKYKGHYCYKLFWSWQMCHLKNYSSCRHSPLNFIQHAQLTRMHHSQGM
mgnify:CR=1 FL=1